jgi:acetolactate synthase regulatory subunit
VSDYSLQRFVRLRVNGELVEVVLRLIGKLGFIVSHAMTKNEHPSSLDQE